MNPAMNTEYDPEIIQSFADTLYTQARILVFLYTVGAAVTGAGIAYYIEMQRGSGLAVFAGASILGAIGYAFGQMRAFQLKLQAQTALCQKKIEENTRKGQSFPKMS